MSATSKRAVKRIASFLLLLIFIWMAWQFLDMAEAVSGMTAVLQSPFLLLAILTVYLLAFCLRALAWKIYLKGRPRFLTCLLGVIYSLFVNHLLPVKAGDLVRMKVMSERDRELTGGEIVHSVVILRVLDMLCLVGIAGIGLVLLNTAFRFSWILLLAGAIATLLIYFAVRSFYPEALQKQWILLKEGFSGKTGIFVFLLTLGSWIAEGAILFGTTQVLGGNLTVPEAVFSNSLTVAGQVFQITPGGLANYEGFMVLALNLLDFSFEEGYTVAVVTHALKFIFSYVTGAAAMLIFPIKLKNAWRKKGGKM
ncbi:YbhN family protein [Bacillus sp. SCS-153A]|uniref:lysylphosphatidylglycerol synthase transmembrane domain-containing protein n=1 Tax=Rossellomorea sedimentorum TaxID=3115294 RepID=UPI0039066561